MTSVGGDRLKTNKWKKACTGGEVRARIPAGSPGGVRLRLPGATSAFRPGPNWVPGRVDGEATLRMRAAAWKWIL